jgi:hypothetical protein
VGSGRSTERHGKLHRSVRDRQPRHERLERAHAVPAQHPRHTHGLDPGRPARNLALLVHRGVVDVDLEQEPIELRFRKRIGSLLLDGITRRKDVERIGQRMRFRADRHTFLLHGLQERRLGLRGRPVDLVGEHQVVEDGPGQEAHGAPARPGLGVGFFLENVGPGDVSGQQIGRELHPAERNIQGLGERRHEQGLREARNAHEERVTARQQGHEHVVDDVLLAHDPDGDRTFQRAPRVSRQREEVDVGRAVRDRLL